MTARWLVTAVLIVGAGEDRWRDGEPERLCGVEIDDQLKPRRLLDGQIGGFSAFEDLSDVNASLMIGTGEAGSIADQAASSDEFACKIDRRNGMACRQRHELLAPVVKDRVGSNDEPAGMRFDDGRESRVDLAFVAGFHDLELQSLYVRRFLHVLHNALGNRIVWVHEQGDHLGSGSQL